MRVIHSAQFELSVDGVPRSYRDRKDLALQGAQILKARNPNSVVRLKDLKTGRDRHRIQVGAVVTIWPSSSARPVLAPASIRTDRTTRLLRRMGWSEQSALILVDVRHRPMRRSDRLRPRHSFRWVECLEGVGEAGRGALPSLGPLAALPNRRRFFVNLLRGVTPFRRGRYRCRSNVCGRNGEFGNDLIGAFGDTRTQSQEAKRGCALRLQS